MNATQAIKRLRSFAESSCRGQSPLYAHLCDRTAEDQRLVEIMRCAPEGQPPPNLFLAAVHFLLLDGASHDLSNYYASRTDAVLPPDESFPAFQDFCLRHESRIRELMATRRVQTNEVRRCAYLYPAFSWIGSQHHDKPLAVAEVGTSAGLLLNWDRYAYDYSTGMGAGREDSTVRIQSELKGGVVPPIPEQPPIVSARVGIDIHTINLNDEQDERWLRSLVWPDQSDRMALIVKAITQFKKTPAKLIEGDAFDLVPAALDSFSKADVACVFHCHTLNQFGETARRAFRDLLSICSQRRLLYQISAEWIHTPQPQLRITRWEKGACHESHVAKVDHHGRWIEWNAGWDERDLVIQ